MPKPEPQRSATGAAFVGFRPLTANFTQTPNQFFDVVLGRYPLRVVTVVGILIRATLGYEDPLTGERRMEAELPLSAFLRPELSENSARQGIREAIAAGFVVETATRTNRDGSRYALRWANADELKRTIERQRRAAGDTRPFAPEESEEADGGPKIGGPNSGPPIFGGPNSAPPSIKKTLGEKKGVNSNGNKPLNVVLPKPSEGFVTRNGDDENIYQSLIGQPVRDVVALTEDVHSIPRFVQLREICLEQNATGAWEAAFLSTKQRKAKQGTPLGKPGAWFNRVCVRELEKRGVTVPTKAETEAEDVDEIRGAIAASLAGIR